MTGPELVALRPTAMAAGGEAVAREASGRVVFVRGALPGEAVVARMVEERDRYARAVVERVDDAVARSGRAALPVRRRRLRRLLVAAHRSRGAAGAQRQIAEDALTRAGGVAGAVVVDGPELPTEGFRTTVRLAVTTGGPGTAGCARTRSSPSTPASSPTRPWPPSSPMLGSRVPTRWCCAAPRRPASGWPGSSRGRRGRRRPPADVLRDPDAWLTEEVAGRPLRVSARSFFQTRPDGAAALVATVAQAAGDDVGRGTVVDAYAGVGLFSACLPVTGRVVAVESSASSCRDAEGQPGAPGRRDHPRRRGPLAPGSRRHS